MKRTGILRPLSYLFGLLLFTGCLTVEEHYVFKKNGSGTMEYVMDLSAMSEMMDALGAMEDDDGEKIGDSDNGPDFADEMAALKNIPGISKIKVKEKDMVSSISYRFDNIDALNKALNVLMPDTTGVSHEFFRRDGNVLKRRHNSRSDMASAIGEDEEMDTSAEFLEQMKYKVSIKASPGLKVTGYGDAVAATEKGSKEILLETDFKVLAEDPVALDLTIDTSK